MELILELNEKTRLLDAALSQFGKRGRERAQAEHDYRVALSVAMLQERENGVPATVLSDVCRGRKDIAKLKMDRDIADTMYDSCKEALNVLKLQVRVLEEAIQREWNQS